MHPSHLQLKAPHQTAAVCTAMGLVACTQSCKLAQCIANSLGWDTREESDRTFETTEGYYSQYELGQRNSLHFDFSFKDTVAGCWECKGMGLSGGGQGSLYTSVN